MIDLNDLPENTAELLQEALNKDMPKPASGPQEKAEPSNGLSEDALTALCGGLLSTQRRMQEEIAALRTELTAESKKATSLQAELDEVQSLYVKALLTEEPPPMPKGSRCLHTAGVAALLTPLFFGGGSLVSLALQRLAGSWSAVGGTLLACIACAVLGMLLLLLAKCGGTLRHWLTADNWPEGPKEEFAGKEP